MIGLDTFVGTKRSFIGIDWLNFGGSALKTAGGAFGGGGAGGTDAQTQAAAQAKAAADKQKAEDAASMWKKIGVVALLAMGVGGVVWYKKTKI